MSDQGKSRRRLAGGELVIPVMAVAFTLYFFTTIIHSPWTAQVSAFLIGGILLLLCLIFFVKVALELSRGDATFGFSNLCTFEDVRSGRLALLVTTVAYVMVIDWGGFTLTTFFFLAISMAALSRGKNLGRITLVSAIMALAGWALFIWAFDTRFPRGPFEEFMKAVLSNG